jgi:multidrug resistance efflux pump
MLNISPDNRINVSVENYGSFKIIEQKKYKSVIQRVLYTILIIFILILFLPWTQNIRSIGNVTTLKPDQRPQTIHSVIPGRVEKWFVKEGDFVKKGDTILFISEIKDEYFDSSLIDRTGQQIKAKELTVQSYMDKVKALDNQVDAIAQTLILKLEQTTNKLKQAYLKVTSDSIDYEASKLNYSIANDQFERMKELYAQGLKSLTDLEARKLKMQEAQAKMISQENKLLTTKNELINTRVELSSIKAEYQDKISKTESDKYSAISNLYDAEISVTKLQNQFMNYSVRSGFYYITAPQDGYITKAIQTGIGETLKEGEEIVSIMPSNYELAVEMYVEPIDLPLLEIGQNVRVQFDGWPAVVFSGWPNISYGTYSGNIVAIDNFISENGKYRTLIAPDKASHSWPTALRVGAGANSIALLKEVPIWYELWRKTNGFPPDYYKKYNAPKNITK